MRIIAVVIHYNEPEKAEVIYKKLVKEGFEYVILFDNGSDKAEPSPLTNLRVDVNNFFGTGIRYVLDHILDTFDFDYFFYTSTSLLFDELVNYRQELLKAIEVTSAALPLAVGTVQFTERQSLDRFQSGMSDTSNAHYLISQVGEATHFCVARQLLEIIRDKKLAFFDRELVRGWAMDFDLEVQAHRYGFINIRIKGVEVQRDSLLAYSQGKRNESRSSYETEGRKEFEAMIKRRYGPDSFNSFDSVRNFQYRKLYVNRLLVRCIRKSRVVGFPSEYRIKKRKMFEIRLKCLFKGAKAMSERKCS